MRSRFLYTERTLCFRPMATDLHGCSIGIPLIEQVKILIIEQVKAFFEKPSSLFGLDGCFQIRRNLLHEHFAENGHLAMPLLSQIAALKYAIWQAHAKKFVSGRYSCRFCHRTRFVSCNASSANSATQEAQANTRAENADDR